MHTFPFRTDEKSEAFCHSIAGEMVTIFGIPEREALRRISRFWSHLPALVGEEDMIYHETADCWAKTIYYGAASYWWIEGEARTTKGLPALTPQPMD